MSALAEATAPDVSTAPAVPAWRLLLGYIRPHRWSLLLGAVLALATGGTGLALPMVARSLIHDLGQDRSITGALLGMSALVIANAALGALGSYVLRRTAESVVLGARRTLSSYLLRLSITAVDRTEPGDLMARITSDTTLLRAVTTDSLVGLGTGGLTLCLLPHREVLRPHIGAHHARRPGPRPVGPARPEVRHRLRRTGRAGAFREPARQPAARQPGRRTGRRGPGPEDHPSGRSRRPTAPRRGHPRRAPRHQALRR